jgi:arabinose-5-phosphate isomerase
MHAADAIHGDLGMMQQDDVAICISKSGNSPEIKTLAPLITKGGNILIGMVGNTDSYLAENSSYILDTTVDVEACPNNLAPTTSTVAQMAMGDALAVALIKCRDFNSDDFSRYHPGGAFGKKLYLTLLDIANGNSIPSVSSSATLSECIMAMTKGRMGAVVVLKGGKLTGIVTDGDLRRMLTKYTDIGHFKAEDIMTASPKTLSSDTMAMEGVAFLNKNKINHIILEHEGIVKGVVHIQDLIREGLI